VCVVGDASQTIYSFAGASSGFLLGFERRYDEATVVRLEQNYRSTAPVVAAANELMRGRQGSLVLHAASSEQAPTPSVASYASDAAEAAGVAASVAASIAAGTAPESIAVLYRVNVQSGALETALTQAGVPYRIHGARRFFDQPEVKQAVLALRAASVTVSGEPLFKSVSDVLRSLGWSQSPPEGAGAVRDRWESLNALMTLADQAAPGTTFRRFTDELLERQAGQHEPTVRAVTLATLHSAKGLEWDEVHIVGLSEGLVPISYARTFDDIDEERRLLYVGITRAKRRLRLSWSESGTGRAGARQPSRFLEELGSRIERAVRG
jgi:DNA helicase-2/ATP-dependent DNA helicase PcrA